jgi:heme a synthase
MHDDWRLRLTVQQRRRLRLWFWSIAVATLVVVVIGGATRLTRSGLSIVEWRPVTGVIPPMTHARWMDAFEQYRQFPEYRQLRQGMTLAEFKFIFFWEYLHRLVARGIGVVFLVPLVLFWRAGYLIRPIAWRAAGLFGLGALQGTVGWLMVKSGLVDRPSVSHYRLALHLALAMTIVGAAVWCARELAVPARRQVVTTRARRILTRGLIWIGVLLAVQIVWGAFVAGLRAGLFYNTFPLMAGQWLPPTGLSPGVALLALASNPTIVQWVHRLLGTILLAVTAMFFVRVRRTVPDGLTRRLNAALLALVAFQYALGVVTLIYRVPVAAGVAHQAVAVLIVAVWVIWLQDVRSREMEGTAREGALSRAPLERAERSTAYVGAGFSRPERGAEAPRC